MKFLSLFACLIIASFCYSQEYYVPYRVNNKFGLADKKGKLVIDAQYNNLEYIDKDYFVARNIIEVDPKDRWTSNSKNVEAVLIKGKKILIADATYENFLLADNFIVNSKNPFRPENCSLYTLNGKLLLSNVQALYIDDERDIKYLNRADAKYDFISTIERDNYGNRLFSMALYDIKAQKIEKWLLKNVTKYEVVNYGDGFVGVTFYDEKGLQHKNITYSNGTFNLTDAQHNVEKEAYGGLGHGMYGEVAFPTGEIHIDREAYPVAMDAPHKVREYSEEEMERMGMIYYTVKNDSLYYVRDKERRFVAMSDPLKHVYVSANSKFIRQKESVILKKNNRHLLIVKGIESTVLYDSIYYLGENFIVGNKVGNTMKFGILNRAGQEILPIVYDSIKGTMMKLDFAEKKDVRVMQFAHEGRDKYSRVPFNPYVKKASTYIQLHKGGKTGIISSKMEVLIPLEYDLIARNELNFFWPKKGDYVILKKDNKYGVAFIGFNSKSNKFEIKDTIAPVFKDVPCFYINSYFGIENLRIWGLYGSDADFTGYAAKDGTTYYREK